MANPAPPPAPNPEETSILLQKFVGLKNVVGAERLGPDELEKAINIDLDDVGQIRRRRGYHPFGNWSNFRCHSLFESDEHRVFVARQVGSQWRLVEVMDPTHQGQYYAVVGPDPISYTQIGPRIYYTSASAAGIITLPSSDDNGAPTGSDAIYSAWGNDQDIFYSPVVNPTANLPAIRGSLYGKPPLATCLAALNGRIYLGNKRTVWYTELYDYNHVDKTRNFWHFEAPITMIGSVTDGLYVGTKEGLWFIGGTTDKPKRIRVMDSGVLPGSMVYVPAELANPPQVPLNQDTDNKIAILFMTHAGYCGGQDGGTCYNFSENKVIFPDAEQAAAMFRRQDGINQYVAVTSGGGTPSASTRIGDYVEAEIRRGGASWITQKEGITLGDQIDAVKV